MTARDKLESIIRVHAEPEVFSKFRHFHVSVLQKLWSVDRYCESIAGLKRVVSYEPPGRWDPNTNDLVAEASTDEQFLRSANMFLDGLLMNAMAALDTLAHEIGVVYEFQGAPSIYPSKWLGNLYIDKIPEKVKKCHPTSRLAEYLESELVKDWFHTLDMYRNCTTHESLVAIEMTQTTSLITEETERSVPLPDDPRSWSPTHAKNRELRSYSESVRQDVKRIVSQSYACIAEDLLAADNRIPIPPALQS